MHLLPIAGTERVKPFTFQTVTFGCKVNKTDSVALENLLLQYTGVQISEEEKPDCIVVNTCTVTHAADRQARQTIRKLKRQFPAAKIMVTGCSVEAFADQYHSMKEVAHVVPISMQSEIPSLLHLGVPTQETKKEFSNRTRAFLKLQDGCNAYCSFCILPYVRGRSHSVPLSELQAQALQFQSLGYREVVITGTHIGAYGRDLVPRLRFSDALRAIAAAAPHISIRVSSLEPTTLTPDVLEALANKTQFRPHFHIPLQSGSDSVLRRMNRKYKTDHYAKRVQALSRTQEKVAIGADLIAGFPGETEEEHTQTKKLVESLPITYLHVFPFSSRTGTRAALFGDEVPTPIKKIRSQELRAIGSRKRKQFQAELVGTNQTVLVEGKRDRSGRWMGYTPHYAPVRFFGGDRLKGLEVEVRIVSAEGETLAGEVL